MEMTAELAAPARILMVDDDPGIRDVVSDFLGMHGYNVATAGEAREMERALAQGPVDLIILDVMLPERDGFSVLGELRAAGEHHHRQHLRLQQSLHQNHSLCQHHHLR